MTWSWDWTRYEVNNLVGHPPYSTRKQSKQSTTGSAIGLAADQSPDPASRKGKSQQAAPFASTKRG